MRFPPDFNLLIQYKVERYLTKKIKIMKNKLNLLFIIILYASFNGTAQRQQGSKKDGVKVLTPIDFFYTQPMSTYPKVLPSEIPRKEGPAGLKGKKLARYMKNIGESISKQDPLVQKEALTRISKPPIQNFDGININIDPPDPTGAVGPNHFVQMTNGLWSVWNKEGVQASGFPKSLTDPLGEGEGDPIVLYDREADRWFISQFILNGSNGTGHKFLIAISTSGDPNGSYAVYTFESDFNDFPKYAIYGNSYVLSGNFYPYGRIYAFNREAMLDGDPNAQMIATELPEYVFSNKHSMPVHSEGPGIAAGEALFISVEDDSGPAPQDQIKIWELDIDWNNPSASSVSEPIIIETAAFDTMIEGTEVLPGFIDEFANLNQPNTSQRIDMQTYAISYHVNRYDFGSHESLVLNFTVETIDNSRISGLRWIELRRSSGSDWVLYQEGTFVDPNGNESLFSGGTGIDSQGNIALAYIKTGTETFPSLYYTGRTSNDPLGQMTLQEQLIVEGTTSVTDGSRYGDYSQLTRDPSDDLTFWYSAEYSGQPRVTRIASFKITDLLSVDDLIKNDSDFIVTNIGNNNYEMTLHTDATNDILRLSVFNLQGKRILYNQVEKQDGHYKQHIDLSFASSGVYIIAIGNANTKLSKKIIVE